MSVLCSLEALKSLSVATYQASGNRAAAYPTAGVGGWPAAAIAGCDAVDCLRLRYRRHCLGFRDAGSRSDVAQGQIIPRGQVAERPASWRAASFAEIFVHEGMTVAAQQPLIKFARKAATSERDQFEARRANLKLQLIRIEAQSRDEIPDFGWLAKGFRTWPRNRRNCTSAPLSSDGRSVRPLKPRLAQKRSEIATLNSGLQMAHAQVEVHRNWWRCKTAFKRRALAPARAGLRRNTCCNVPKAKSRTLKASSLRREMLLSKLKAAWRKPTPRPGKS